MEGRFFLLFLSKLTVVALLVLPVLPALAASESEAEDALLAEEQPVRPEVKRREISEAQIDTENFELGFFSGVYSTENFGANSVVGARFAYHVTEDFFVEVNAGSSQTEPSTPDKQFKVNILTKDEHKLDYYNVVVGYNLFPGESFVTDNWVFKTAFYVVGGVGNTEFAGDKQFTIVFGPGFRLVATDWLAFHADFRDHIFELDIFEEETTHNLEMHLGVTIFF